MTRPREALAPAAPMSQGLLPRRIEQSIAEPQLSCFGLHVHLANEGDVAGDTQFEVADDEAVELGHCDPARVIFDRRRPVADSGLLSEQCRATALVDQVMACRGFELDQLRSVGGDGSTHHLAHRVQLKRGHSSSPTGQIGALLRTSRKQLGHSCSSARFGCSRSLDSLRSSGSSSSSSPPSSSAATRRSFKIVSRSASTSSGAMMSSSSSSSSATTDLRTGPSVSASSSSSAASTSASASNGSSISPNSSSSTNASSSRSSSVSSVGSSSSGSSSSNSSSAPATSSSSAIYRSFVSCRQPWARAGILRRRFAFPARTACDNGHKVRRGDSGRAATDLGAP